MHSVAGFSITSMYLLRMGGGERDLLELVFQEKYWVVWIATACFSFLAIFIG